MRKIAIFLGVFFIAAVAFGQMQDNPTTETKGLLITYSEMTNYVAQNAAPPSNLFQAIYTNTGEKVIGSTNVITLPYETIKDSYYTHSPTNNSGEVTIVHRGWYRISAMLNVVTVSSSGSNRGAPTLSIQISTNAGSTWIQQPDRLTGYVREDSAKPLGTSITGMGVFQFGVSNIIRLVHYDRASTVPDQEVAPFGTRMLIEYIRDF